jgi:anti-sigma factor RsiW
MIRCKQLEKFYTEYVCDLLDEAQVARIEEHLRACPTCTREVQSLQETLYLIEAAEEMPIPPAVLNNIEMNVYKRIATESPPPKRARFVSKFLAAFRLPLTKRRYTWIVRSALATLALVISISIATVFINQDQSLEVLIQSPHERIELYRQEEIRSNRTEALETRHLRGNDRLATLQLLVLTEQAP